MNKDFLDRGQELQSFDCLTPKSHALLPAKDPVQNILDELRACPWSEIA